jgi:hypothetical protein
MGVSKTFVDRISSMQVPWRCRGMEGCLETIMHSRLVTILILQVWPNLTPSHRPDHHSPGAVVTWWGAGLSPLTRQRSADMLCRACSLAEVAERRPLQGNKDGSSTGMMGQKGCPPLARDSPALFSRYFSPCVGGDRGKHWGKQALPSRVS